MPEQIGLAGGREPAARAGRKGAGAYRPDLAMALSNLSVCLSEVGQRREALAPAKEAVAIRRDLAATPDTGNAPA
jgi:hypothetical protein